jgi:hypothetical protein
MKSLSAALVFGLFISGLCFSQTQTGNASYNASKSGLTIAHPSMSFGTRVRVTNLRNNREVITTVDGRIASGDSRVVDISAEAGDAIGMARQGYTEVRLEQLIPLPTVPAAAPPPEPAVIAAVQPAAPPPASSGGVPAAPPRPSAPAASAPAPSSTRETIVEPIQIITPPAQPQYLVVPTPEGRQSCFSSPLCVAILILLIIMTLLLAAILILLLWMRRFPWWPWLYSVWARRHIRYIKRRRL